MSFLLRLLLVALAGIWLVGARHASQRSGTWPSEAKLALRQQAAVIRAVSQEW